MDNFICDNISKNTDGKLMFRNHDVTLIAEQYGTPIYIFDENKIRENCKTYTDSFKKYMPTGSFPAYAGKAACFKYIYKIMADENMGVDLVSPGEVYTAYTAEYDMSKSFFHGNCKTDDDIKLAMDCKVGYFVVDNTEELEAINKKAKENNIKQKILLRLAPGIDPHTYKEVNTGCVDSKFGCAIETGQAEEIAKAALSCENISLCGFHCHVGSQVFLEDVFEKAAKVMLEFIKYIKDKYDYEAEILNLGGGIGVRYVSEDPEISIEERIKLIADTVIEKSKELNINTPSIVMEPGRSIVANAGMTVYTVGSVKRIPGYKNYVCIDGGMADNPRYALYESKYTCLFADNLNETCDMKCDLVGRCCESGDIIAKEINLPSNVKRGDHIAVCTTGAYNYSMASNYNRLAKPSVIMLKDDKEFLAVKRETLPSVTENDL